MLLIAALGHARSKPTMSGECQPHFKEANPSHPFGTNTLLLFFYSLPFLSLPPVIFLSPSHLCQEVVDKSSEVVWEGCALSPIGVPAELRPQKHFYRATTCNATHGIAVAILSVCLSVRQMRVL